MIRPTSPMRGISTPATRDEPGPGSAEAERVRAAYASLRDAT